MTRFILTVGAVLAIAGAGAGTAAGACKTVSTADGARLNFVATQEDRWGAAGIPFVNDFTDPNVSFAAWMKTAPGRLARMTRAIRAMQPPAAALTDGELRGLVTPITTNFAAALRHAKALYAATKAQDEQAAKAALARIRATGRRSSALGKRYLVVLKRDYC